MMIPPMTPKVAHQIGLLLLHGGVTSLSWYRPSDYPYRDLLRWVVAHKGLDARHLSGRHVIIHNNRKHMAPPEEYRGSTGVGVGSGWLAQQLEQYHSPQT